MRGFHADTSSLSGLVGKRKMQWSNLEGGEGGDMAKFQDKRLKHQGSILDSEEFVEVRSYALEHATVLTQLGSTVINEVTNRAQ